MRDALDSLRITCTSILPPSCTDLIQNQGEAGIDCGGPCAAVCLPACLAAGTECTLGSTCSDCCFGSSPEISCVEVSDGCNGSSVQCGPTGRFLCDTAPVCGDWLVNVGEVCDDGNQFTETGCLYGTPSCTRCNADCTAVLNLAGPYCGNGGTPEAGEQCDLGFAGNGACPNTCSASCTSNLSCFAGTCNDSLQNQGETAIDCGGPNCVECPPAACSSPPSYYWIYSGDAGSGEGNLCVIEAIPAGDYANQLCNAPNVGILDFRRCVDRNLSVYKCTAIPCSCADGIQSPGETRVDCGGPNCLPCPPICGNGVVEFPEECDGATTCARFNGLYCKMPECTFAPCG